MDKISREKRSENRKECQEGQEEQEKGLEGRLQDKADMGMPTVISAFAGCGGSSLGYKLAGFRELLAIDFDRNAAETFMLNFPDVPIWRRDIKDVTAQEILDFCGIERGNLDVLDGSPPCQGFSTAGKRKISDERNDLFREFVRLIDGLGPKVFVMENVSGMMKGKMKGRFVEAMESLKSLPYRVKCKLMNAKYHNVPQSRERLIFVGVRGDLGIEPSFPMPQKKLITAGKALKNIKPDEIPSFEDKYARLWDRIKPGQNASHVIKKGFNSCVKINPLRPCCTLQKTQTGHGFASLVHWKEKRALSINEALILCSFPLNYKLIGDYSEKWSRLGNAVMPKFMQAIAESIRTNILEKHSGSINNRRPYETKKNNTDANLENWRITTAAAN